MSLDSLGYKDKDGRSSECRRAGEMGTILLDVDTVGGIVVAVGEATVIGDIALELEAAFACLSGLCSL
jgi:hypothetical protein